MVQEGFDGILYHDDPNQDRGRVQHRREDRRATVSERVGGAARAPRQHRSTPCDQQPRDIGQVMRGIGQQRE
jgi:hypothetical protein